MVRYTYDGNGRQVPMSSNATAIATTCLYDVSGNLAIAHDATTSLLNADNRKSFTVDCADQRFYASTYGRFNTPDPYQASGGTSSPASWNRYSYTRGDPVNRFDPRGTCDSTTYTSDGNGNFVVTCIDVNLYWGGDSGYYSPSGTGCTDDQAQALGFHNCEAMEGGPGAARTPDVQELNAQCHVDVTQDAKKISADILNVSEQLIGVAQSIVGMFKDLPPFSFDPLPSALDIGAGIYAALANEALKDVIASAGVSAAEGVALSAVVGTVVTTGGALLAYPAGKYIVEPILKGVINAGVRIASQPAQSACNQQFPVP